MLCLIRTLGHELQYIIQKNPDAFLDGVITRLNRLNANPKYAELSHYAKEKAAVYHTTNPEAFLDDYIASFHQE
jgi:hypothetical protein